MRVLYLSRADAFDDTSSLVIIAKGMLGHAMRADPELFVTWVIPRGAKDAQLQEYIVSAMPDPSRIRFEKLNAGLAGRTLGYLFNEEVWYRLTQTKVGVPYDVVLTNQLALTPMWHTVLANRYQASRYHVPVPIVNWQMWTATMRQLEEVPEYYAGEADVVAESLSSLFAWNVWESDVLYASHIETMEKYCRPAVVEAVQKRSEVISNGVDWPRLNELYEQRMASIDPKEKPVLFWGGRLANQKKPRVTFPLMEQIRQATGVPVVVSTNRPESDPDVSWTRDTFPEWSVYAGKNRTEFGQLMTEGDVFLCNSASESYGLAWVEQLALGMLGVFEEFWWVKQLLPAWYPFVTPDKHEQVMIAKALIESWPDGQHWVETVPRVREWIEREHNEARAGWMLSRTLQREKDRSMFGKRSGGSIAKLIREAAEDVHAGARDYAVPFDLVLARMRERSSSGRDFGKPGDLMSRMYLRRLLELQGWRDVCRSDAVEFVPPR